MIHFEFIFVYDDKEESCFILWHEAFQFSQSFIEEPATTSYKGTQPIFRASKSNQIPLGINASTYEFVEGHNLVHGTQV